jgi:TonB-dependent receptor
MKKTTNVRIAVAISAILGPSLALAQAASSNGVKSSTDGSADDLTEIVVTGIRASAERAMQVKKNADQVVEAVTMEDIGKFTDLTVSDTLQRVPGVQIERDDQGITGDRASIRGLGPSYVQVTVNGRVPLTGGSEGIQDLRQVNLDVVPTEILSGLLVYKTPSAELVEPGLAGSIELQTLRPLDYHPASGQNYFGSVEIDGTRDTEAKSTSPRFSSLVGAQLFDHTLGVYASVLKTDPKVRTDEVFARFANRNLSFDDTGSGVANRTLEGVLVPSQITESEDTGKDHRLAYTFGAQWKPNEHVEVGADFEFMQRNNDQDRAYADLDLNNATNGSIYSGIALPGGYTVSNGYLTGFNTAKLEYPGVAAGSIPVPGFDAYPIRFFNDQKSTVGGLNAAYKGDDWALKFDWGHSTAQFIQDLRAFVGGTQAPNPDVVFNGSTTVPTFTGVTNLNHPAGSTESVLFAREYFNHSDDNSFKLDFQYDLNTALTLKTGVRYQITNVAIGDTVYVASVPAADQAAVDAALFPGGATNYLSGTNFGFDLAGQCYECGAAAAPSISNFNYATQATIDPDFGFRATEKTTAYYLQANWQDELFGIPANGNAGVRAVYTDLNSSSEIATATINHQQIPVASTMTPVSDSNSYWNALPSANLNLHLQKNLNLRLGAGEVMSRPEYTYTAPNNSLTLLQTSDPLNDLSQNRKATLGNTKLKPMTAWVYDVTTEYYTPNHGAVYGSLFYKDIKNFVIDTVTNNVSLPGYPFLFDVNEPVNAPGGHAEGFEVGTDQPLTWLPSPFDGFGVQANFTYVDSVLNGQGLTVAQSASSLASGFPGSSKDNFNGVVYYEKYDFSVRVAYAYRSGYFEDLGGGADRSFQPTWTAGSGQLDLTSAYNFTKNFAITFTGINLSHAVRRDYIQFEQVFRTYVDRPTTYLLGLRGSF